VGFFTEISFWVKNHMHKHEKNMAVVISRLIFHRNQVLLELQLCWRDFTKHFVGQHLRVEKVHLSKYKS